MKMPPHRLHATTLMTGAVTALVLLAAPRAWAQDGAGTSPSSTKTKQERFDALVEGANEAYEARDYDEAVSLYERAYDIEPQANILYNIGRIHERAGHVELALETYRRFLGSAEADVGLRRDALERSKLLTEIVEMRNRASEEARRSLETAAAVDDDPGVEAPGAQVVEREGAGVGPLVLIGLGVGGLATAGVLALQTQQQSQLYLDASRTRGERLDASSAGANLALGADIAMGVGALGVLSGVVWLVAGAGAEPDASALRVAPVLGGGVGARVSFGF